MNKIKNKSQKKNKNKNSNMALKLYKGVDPTYGKTIERLVKYRDTIQINAGTSNFQGTSDGYPYINPFFKLSQSNDFTSVSDSYFLCQPLEFEVKVTRIANDTQLANMGISNPELVVAWNPCVLAYTNNNIALNNELALRIPSLALEPHSRIYPIRPLQVAIADGSTFVYNPAVPVLVTEFLRLPGCLTFATFNTTNSTVTVRLYLIEITCRMKFLVPF